MNKLFNIFLVGVFVLMTFTFLPSSANAVALALAVEDSGWAEGGGGSSVTSTPTPPPTPPSTINLVSSLNKSTYNPGESVVLTASVSRSVCSNTLSEVEVQGYIVGQGSYTTVLRQTVAGGVVISGTQFYTASATPGNYIMRVKVNVYSPAYYFAFFSEYSSGETVGYLSGVTQREVIIAADQELNNMPAGTTYEIGYQPAGIQVLESATLDIPFTVSAPALPKTADLTIKRVSDGSIHKSDFTVPAGETVEVFWECKNFAPATVDATAKAIMIDSNNNVVGSPAVIGKEIRKLEGNPYQHSNIQYKTIFTLDCND